MYNIMDTIVDKLGAEICVCSAHQLEYCGRCCVDFRDMNQDQRKDAAQELTKTSQDRKKRQSQKKGGNSGSSR